MSSLLSVPRTKMDSDLSPKTEDKVVSGQTLTSMTVFVDSGVV